MAISSKQKWSDRSMGIGSPANLSLDDEGRLSVATARRRMMGPTLNGKSVKPDRRPNNTSGEVKQGFAWAGPPRAFWSVLERNDRSLEG